MKQLTPEEQQVVLQQALEEYPQQEEVIEDFCRHYSKLSDFLKVNVFFTEASLLESLMRAIRRTKPLTKALTNCLWVLARPDCNKWWFAGQGHLEYLVQLINAQDPQDNTELTDHMCCALRNLSNDSKTPEIIVKHGGLDYLYRVLTDPRSPEDLVSSATRALLNLVDSDPHRQLLIDNNIVEFLARFLPTIMHSPDVLEPIISLVWEIAMVSGVEPRIAENGCIELILQAMKAFPDSVDLQISCAGALCALSAMNLTIASRIKDNHGVQLLTASLKRHCNNEAAAEFILNGLCNLNDVESEEHFVDLVELTALSSLVIEAMTVFPDNPDIYTNGVCVLAEISSFETIANHVAKNGGIGLILKGMEQFAGIGDVQDAGMIGLRGLAWLRRTGKELVRQGAIELILRAMKRHPILQTSGIVTLTTFANVANDQEAEMSAVLTRPVFESVLHALETNYKEKDVVDSVLRFLKKLPQVQYQLKPFWLEHQADVYLYRAMKNASTHQIHKKCGTALRDMLGPTWKPQLVNNCHILFDLLLTRSHDTTSLFHQDFLPLDVFKLITHYAHLGTYLPRRKTRFTLLFETWYGQHVCLTGSPHVLGRWDLSKVVPLHTDETSYPLWSVDVPLNRRRRCEYKFILTDSDYNLIKWINEAENLVWTPTL